MYIHTCMRYDLETLMLYVTASNEPIRVLMPCLNTCKVQHSMEEAGYYTYKDEKSYLWERGRLLLMVEGI